MPRPTPQPEPIVVTGTRDRINTLNSRLPDVRDAPQSISIIPREIIEQQSASTLRDVLRNVSGISMAAGEGGGGPAGDNLTLRGFGARNDIFVDGIRDFASYTRDTFNVEQVEVVKGPSSAQTGRGSTGGYINMFSKQPELRHFVGGTRRRRRARLHARDRRPQRRRSRPRRSPAPRSASTRSITMPTRRAATMSKPSAGASRRRSRSGWAASTRAILSYVCLEQDNVPDYGIPFVPATNIRAWPNIADQPAPVDYDNYYGLLERDREKPRSTS